MTLGCKKMYRSQDTAVKGHFFAASRRGQFVTQLVGNRFASWVPLGSFDTAVRIGSEWVVDMRSERGVFCILWGVQCGNLFLGQRVVLGEGLGNGLMQDFSGELSPQGLRPSQDLFQIFREGFFYGFAQYGCSSGGFSVGGYGNSHISPGGQGGEEKGA